LPGSEFAAFVLSVNGSMMLKGSHTISSVPAAGFQRRMTLPPATACPAKPAPRRRTGP